MAKREYSFLESRTYPLVAHPPQPELVWRSVHGTLVQVKVYKQGDRLREDNTFRWEDWDHAIHLAPVVFDIR